MHDTLFQSAILLPGVNKGDPAGALEVNEPVHWLLLGILGRSSLVIITDYLASCSPSSWPWLSLCSLSRNPNKETSLKGALIVVSSYLVVVTCHRIVEYHAGGPLIDPLGVRRGLLPSLLRELELSRLCYEVLVHPLCQVVLAFLVSVRGVPNLVLFGQAEGHAVCPPGSGSDRIPSHVNTSRRPSPLTTLWKSEYSWAGCSSLEPIWPLHVKLYLQLWT